jgi:alkylation response protein AidB-like acyl-CoA dehydrogenase
MRAEIDASRLLALEVSWVKGQGGIARELVMMAKIHATEMAVRVADAAMRTFAGWGYSKDHAVERLYRDALANVPAGLPTDRLRELVACAMVGADPWAYEPFDWLGPAGLSLEGSPR